MISDASLYSLAIFLGSASMLMIVLYHFLEINAQDPKEPLTSERKADALPAKARRGVTTGELASSVQSTQ
ncbi:hypothetical protein D0861_00747 [Hortaea werneckii]|uniref:Dolichyl-diphosphooligosaccharide--protein glycosyltransferase subunit 4 n=1 Tax=Hortaea werneckii TaxID=91943 RepID=A0A3M7G2H0_HORWE|nr:hypothetical protein D0861_00747 [Hortaea werneckii]